jgi:hypothetical protein
MSDPRGGWLIRRFPGGRHEAAERVLMGLSRCPGGSQCLTGAPAWLGRVELFSADTSTVIHAGAHDRPIDGLRRYLKG